MINEPKDLNDKEKIEVENEFLKLKLMAEHGGEVYSGDADVGVPMEVENQFLSNVIEFERQFSLRRTITVFKKIGSPQHFKPESEIPQEEIEQAWGDLAEYMYDRGVELSACSPRVTARQLYRFTTEELFNHETDDINIPGMMTGFIYDEFYPDHEYDNSRTASNECIALIFNKRRLEWMHNFTKQVRFNEHSELAIDDFKELINRFKELCDEMELSDLRVNSCIIEDTICVARGQYCASIKIDSQVTEHKGNWVVEFVFDEGLDFWQIRDVQIQDLAL